MRPRVISLWGLVLVLTVSIAGCSSPQQSENEFAESTVVAATADGDTEESEEASEEPASTAPISKECVDAMEASKREGMTGTDDDTALLATVSACGSYEEWLSAALADPEAIGFTHFPTGSEPDQMLGTICSTASGPVCDSAARVLGDEPWEWGW